MVYKTNNSESSKDSPSFLLCPWPAGRCLPRFNQRAFSIGGYMKNIDQEWEANRTKATKILEAIKYALTHPAEAAGNELPADLENPESQTEVESINVFSQHCYDKAAELANVFEDMAVGDKVQHQLDNIMDELGETMSHSEKMQEYGLKEGGF